MANGRVPKFLFVMSLLLIIFGSMELIVGIIGAVAGGAIAVAGAQVGSAGLIGLGVTVAVLFLIGGVLELISGIFSLTGKHLGFCQIFALVILVLAVINLFMTGGSGAAITMGIIDVVFIALYLWSLMLARRQLG